MKQISLTALALAVHLALTAACAGGEVEAPSPRDPSSPRAPEAPFDPGANPLGAGLSPMPSASSAPMPMPMPSGSAAPAPGSSSGGKTR